MIKIEIVSDKNDKVLKVLENQCANVNYSSLAMALRKKDILVNGIRIKDNINVAIGSNIVCYVGNDAIKKNIINIVYEDENIVIVNKGKNIETCDGNYNLLNELKKSGKEVYAVHRLDRNTTGLVIFAKDENVQNILINEFSKKNIEKYYYAEIYGNPKQKKVKLTGYLVKDSKNSCVKIYSNKVKNSEFIETEFEVIKQSGNVCLLSVKIKEGKTHQIRAHLAYNDLFIIGDGKYGKNEINAKFKSKTQHLKAYKIIFNIENSKLKYLNDLHIELDNKF